jgi:hypothetical protein
MALLQKMTTATTIAFFGGFAAKKVMTKIVQFF